MNAKMGSSHRKESPIFFTHHLQARESAVAAFICVPDMTTRTNVQSDSRLLLGSPKATIVGDLSLAPVRSDDAASPHAPAN